MYERKIRFNHEKLEVYQRSLKFCAWLDNLVSTIKGNRNLIDQIERASISLILNTAEGNGKTPVKDSNRFFKIARS